MSIGVTQVRAFPGFENRHAALFMGAKIDDGVNEMVAVERDQGFGGHD